MAVQQQDTTSMAAPAPAWAPHDDEPNVKFNLSNDKKRTTVTPRDVASLVMWSVLPITHPLASDAPRWCFVDQLRKVRSAVVVSVDGLTYDDVARSDWAPAGSSPAEAAANAAGAADPAARPNTWLAAVRRLGGPVQFAPLWVNNTSGRLEAEFFFRQDRKQRLRHAATRAAEAAASGKGDAVVATKVSSAGPAPDNGGNTGHGKMGKAGDILAWAKRQTKRVNNASSEGSSPVPAGGSADAAPGAGTPAATSATDEGTHSHHERLHNALEQERQAAAEARRLRAMTIPEPTLNDWAGASQEQLCGMAMTTAELVDHSFQLQEEPGFLRLPQPTESSEGAVAIDCEMVLAAGQVSILARVSVVRVPSGEVLMDEIVKPRLPVVDHVTRYSGITPEMLAAATLSFEEAQAAVCKLVSRETFVVGHGLENDFLALRLLPSDLARVLDTTHMYPHPNGLPNKNALRFLAHTYLGGRRIQTGVDGHDSIEDASVCIELVGLKLRNGKDFGLPARVNITQLMSVEHKTEPAPSWEPPVISVVERSDALRRVCSRATNAIPARNDGDASRKTAAALNRCGANAGAGRGVVVYTRLNEVCPAEENEENEAADVAAAAAAPTAPAAKDGGDADESAESAKKQHRAEGESSSSLVPDVAAVADDHESQPWYPCCKLNTRLARIINAAPAGTLICVMAAMPPTGDSPNRHASAHGSLLAFVKTETTPKVSEEIADYIPRNVSAAAAAGCTHA